MNWTHAVYKLKAGWLVRRVSWPPNCFLIIRADAITQARFYIDTGYGYGSPSLSVDDYLADDWEAI